MTLLPVDAVGQDVVAQSVAVLTGRSADAVCQVAAAMFVQPSAFVVEDELLACRAAFGVFLLQEPIVRMPALATRHIRLILARGGSLQRVRTLQRAGRDGVHGCARRCSALEYGSPAASAMSISR